ncbi:MAG: tRNA pseudouridine(38-40) synthase TruA [Bacillota bacterium]
MRNIKFTLEYDGTNYSGWQSQSQSHVQTVQGIMEKRFSLLTKEKTVFNVAGRTDAGVHALGQVVNFYTESSIPPERFPYAAKSILPEDIVVVSAEEVGLDFHARFDARGKTYTYFIWNSATPSAFQCRYSWHIPRTLNTGRMQEGAAYFKGKYDFRSFCTSGSSVKSFVREINDCTVFADGKLIRVEVSANGFLYNMVRIIVGTLAEVGKGNMEPGDIEGIIAAQHREMAGPTAPPQGLFLVRVHY